MPVVGGGKSKPKGPNVFSRIIGGAVRDGEDRYYVDVVGTKNKQGAMVRVRVVSGGEEILRLMLPPKVASSLAILLAHAAYLAQVGGDVVDVLWRYARSGAAEIVEEKARREAEAGAAEAAEAEPGEEVEVIEFA